MQIMGREKRGMTLLEIVVAMAVFAVVTTIAIGAFVSISRMMTLTNNMKNTQQKLRVAIEMVSRLSRQAPVVLVTNTNDVNGKNVSSILDLYFGVNDLGVPLSATRFEINDFGTGRSLFYSECASSMIDPITKKCSENDGWQTASDLLSGSLRLDDTSFFVKTGAIPPTLTVTLHNLASEALGNDPYYSDTLNVVSKIVLEQIR